MKNRLIIDDGCFRYNITDNIGKIAITYAPEDSKYVDRLEVALKNEHFVYVMNPVVSEVDFPYEGFADDVDERLKECSCMIIALSGNLIPDKKELVLPDENDARYKEKLKDYTDKRAKLNLLWYRVGQLGARSSMGSKPSNDRQSPKIFFPVYADNSDGAAQPDKNRPTLEGSPLEGLNISTNIEEVVRTLKERYKGTLMTDEFCVAKRASAYVNPNVFFGCVSFHIRITEATFSKLKNKLQKDRACELTDAALEEIFQYTLRTGIDLLGYVKCEEHEKSDSFLENSVLSTQLSKVTYCPVSGKSAGVGRNKTRGFLYFSVVVPISAKYGVSYKIYLESVGTKDKNGRNIQPIGTSYLEILAFGDRFREAQKTLFAESRDNKLFFCSSVNRLDKDNEPTSGNIRDYECLFPQ